MRGERQRRVMTIALLLGGVGVLGGCASTKATGTDPDAITTITPPTAAELALLPDAVPRQEPPSRSGNPEFYTVFGRNYAVKGTSAGYRARGLASWYGPKFHGKRTSSGRPFDMYALSAAHKTLPIPTYVRVTRLDNGHSIVVRVNDRGPFIDDRLIDLSYAAAVKLDMVDDGTIPVEVTALRPYQYLSRYDEPRGPVATVAAVDETPPKPAVRAGLAESSAVSTSTTFTKVSTVEPAVAIPVAAGSGNAYLQVGAFSQRRRAEQLQGLLRGNLGREVSLARGVDTLHRVRIGPLRTPSEVDDTRRQLAGLGIGQAYLVHD